MKKETLKDFGAGAAVVSGGLGAAFFIGHTLRMHDLFELPEDSLYVESFADTVGGIGLIVALRLFIDIVSGIGADIRGR